VKSIIKHLNELELEILGHGVRLADPEYVSNNVLCRVSHFPQMGHHLSRARALIIFSSAIQNRQLKYPKE
jgi:hypothetical protein